MKEIYIIRHGETELNRLGIVQGRGIDSDLNATGRAQALAFYNHYKDVDFDKVYTSKLKRTHQTVQHFLERNLPWEQHEGLDELAWGEWEGQPNTEEARVAFKEIVEKWQGGNYEAKFEGGESPNDVAFRLRQALAFILANTEEKKVLVCMHGRAMRLFLCILLDQPFAEMGEFPHQNTTLYKLKWDGQHFEVIDFNHTEHLKDLIDTREEN